MNEPRPAFGAMPERYGALMDVVRNRLTSRAFRTDIEIPREHIEMVIEAARHAPVGRQCPALALHRGDRPAT